MTAFEHSARLYDLLYADKPYRQEAEWVYGLARGQGLAPARLLDAGCGSGQHASVLAEMGCEVTGIDQSAPMLALARARRARLPVDVRQRLELVESSLQAYRAGQPFEMAVALFHVMSYQAEPGALDSALAALAANLAPGGLLVFDFWHAPGVLAEPPEVRERVLENDELRALRRSVPHHDPQSRRVEVDIHLEVEDRASGERHDLSERHLLRYFEVEELEQALARHGLRASGAFAWMGDAAPGRADWYACMAAVRG